MLTVDCAALPREALDIELPSDGSLLFFTEIEYEPESSVVLHVPAGVRTTERSAAYELHGEPEKVRVYRPGVPYPVPGPTVSPDWHDAPATGAFLDGGAGFGTQVSNLHDPSCPAPSLTRLPAQDVRG